MVTRLLVLAALFAAVGDLLAPASALAQSDRVVTVMSYNVENLFDTEDNPANTGDNTFLPRSRKGTAEHRALCEQIGGSASQKRECLELDWSEAVLMAKLRNVATVIDGFNGGRGPDILALQEVENRAVLERLRATLRNGQAYITAVNTETSPGRGINVALLSKLRIEGQVQSHKVEFTGEDLQDCGTTRDIVEVPLKLPDGSVLAMFSLHFPSGSNPVKCRVLASERLNEIVAGRAADAMLVAAGDTNINCSPEDQAVIADVLRDRWIVPDETNKGCRAPGSEFFPPRTQWSFLDLIMTSRSLTSSSREGAPWFADFGSFRTAITAPEVQVEADERGRVKPKRFDTEAKTGSADHWPVALDLVRRR
jgi:endonuclease/exonuclease/phosphatase family metal-dependent hydrolase